MMRGKIRQIVGTGGIGKGLFFLSHENDELGRNESRMAKLSDAKDYCKLHIVFHYLGRLLAPEIHIVPIGKIGNDENGMLCRKQMEEAGMNVEWVQKSFQYPTMLSVCIQYPDKSGCNITSDNSACQDVDTEYILKAAKDLNIGADTVVAALPEVPLISRLKLLEYGKSRGAFCVASCGTAEMREFIRRKGPEMCDLIALNQEETAAFTGMVQVAGAEDAKEAARRVLEKYPHLHLWFTFGAEGSMFADRNQIRIYSSLPNVKVVNTGGAGDASLAGLLAGYCLGIALGGEEDEYWETSAELAVLLAGMSVESADSINQEITWESIKERKKRLRFLKGDRI